MSKDNNNEISSTAPGLTSSNVSANDKTFSIRGRVLLGTVFMAGLLIGAGGWSAKAKLSSAVIAPGSVVVEKNVKSVQHPDGGIVSKINVTDGDRVKPGQVLLELDSTQIKAELGIVRAQLTELTARKSRLTAEITGLEKVIFPEGFEEAGEHNRAVAEGERRLFDETRTNLQSQEDQLALQIEQLQQEIEGIKAQRDAKQGQLDIMNNELSQVTKLYEKKLVSVTRIYGLKREAKRLSGESGGLQSQMARANGKISEIKLQILSVRQTARLNAQRDLRSIEAKMAELVEREIAATDRLARTKLLAPQAGIVHELSAHTIGGVITAAQTVLEIVPADERLTIEARIAPVDIDQVSIGRTAKLHFSAFSQEQTPELHGRVVHVSADVARDEDTAQSYYVARVEVTEESAEKLKSLELVPGMPVEIFISTGARTALSYILKPLTDQFNRAFRES